MQSIGQNIPNVWNAGQVKTTCNKIPTNPLGFFIHQVYYYHFPETLRSISNF